MSKEASSPLPLTRRPE